MTQTTHSLRLAGTALAAGLALASTSARAQDAVPPFPSAPAPAPEAVVPEIVVPDIPVPATPEPTVVLPADGPEAAPEPEAAVVESDPVPVAARAQPRASAADRAAPAPEPVAGTAEPAVVDAPAALPPVPAADPVAADPFPPVATEEAADPTSVDTGILALILGGILFLALAIWGFVAIGRRKPVRRYAAVAPAPEARPPVAAEPVHTEPVMADARPPRPVVEPLVTPAPSAGLPHAGAAVALPRCLPDSFEEREALFRRMVDARPDRANPFTDRKARMKRARLIMQSIGRDFGDARPWIDLSQYPHNWPELAQSRSAAA